MKQIPIPTKQVAMPWYETGDIIRAAFAAQENPEDDLWFGGFIEPCTYDSSDKYHISSPFLVSGMGDIPDLRMTSIATAQGREFLGQKKLSEALLYAYTEGSLASFFEDHLSSIAYDTDEDVDDDDLAYGFEKHHPRSFGFISNGNAIVLYAADGLSDLQWYGDPVEDDDDDLEDEASPERYVLFLSPVINSAHAGMEYQAVFRRALDVFNILSGATQAGIEFVPPP